MKPELQKLLERYHDGEVSPQEATEVESLLERDVEALEYPGNLDAMAEMVQTTVHQQVAAVSFDGFWDSIQARIEEEEFSQAKTPAAPSFFESVTGWLRTLFVDNKTAWITAAATAAAVALVMSFMGNGANNAGPGVNPGTPVAEGTRIIERHIVYVDSVDKADPESMVLVNSIKEVDGQDGPTPVIWLVPSKDNQNSPEKGQAEEDNADDENDGIEIVDEPL